MKILALSVGSRGDVQPLLALAQHLEKQGHTIVCAFPERFRDLTQETGYKFIPTGTELIDLVESDMGRNALGGKHTSLSKSLALLKLIRSLGKLSTNYFREQQEIVEVEKPDLIIHNLLALYPLVRGLTTKERTILVSPIPYLHEEKNHAHMFYRGRNFGRLGNKLSYSLVNFVIALRAKRSFDALETSHTVTRKEIMNALFHNKAIYLVSPTLFPTQNYSSGNVHMLGFQELETHSEVQVSDDLEAFLGRHERVLLVTLGSMVNPDPVGVTQMFLDVLVKNNIPAVLVTALGGIIKPDSYDDSLFFFTPKIHYAKILPRVYAAVHHGGSGTTHTTLKHGCPSFVIPHITDQALFAESIYSLGCGPKALPIEKVTKTKLESRIVELFHDPKYRERAEHVSKEMKQENQSIDICSVVVGETTMV